MTSAQSFFHTFKTLIKMPSNKKIFGKIPQPVVSTSFIDNSHYSFMLNNPGLSNCRQIKSADFFLSLCTENTRARIFTFARVFLRARAYLQMYLIKDLASVF